MKQWRFTPAFHDSSPGGRWIQNRIIVKPGDRVDMTLGELVASSQGQADSLYSLLERGSDFDTLVAHSANVSFCKFGRFLGTIDIDVYPKHVRDELRKLSVNEITRPLRLGADYIIYKRYDPERLRRLVQ